MATWLIASHLLDFIGCQLLNKLIVGSESNYRLYRVKNLMIKLWSLPVIQIYQPKITYYPQLYIHY